MRRLQASADDRTSLTACNILPSEHVMVTQLFAITSYPINLLIEQIDSGELGLPDLQRPFVWNRTKIRNLLDSLYRGYPAGYLLLWTTAGTVA